MEAFNLRRTIKLRGALPPWSNGLLGLHFQRTPHSMMVPELLAVLFKTFDMKLYCFLDFPVLRF